MHALAHFLSDLVNPILAVLWAAAWMLRPRGGSRALWSLASLAGLAAGILLAEAGKRLPVWPGHVEFPSGHETFCACVGTSIAVADRRWLPVAALLAAALGWGLVAAGYHAAIDVVAGACLGVSVTTLAHLLAARIARLRHARAASKI